MVEGSSYMGCLGLHSGFLVDFIRVHWGFSWYLTLNPKRFGIGLGVHGQGFKHLGALGSASEESRSANF